MNSMNSYNNIKYYSKIGLIFLIIFLLLYFIINLKIYEALLLTSIITITILIIENIIMINNDAADPLNCNQCSVSKIEGNQQNLEEPFIGNIAYNFTSTAEGLSNSLNKVISSLPDLFNKSAYKSEYKSEHHSNNNHQYANPEMETLKLHDDDDDDDYEFKCIRVLKNSKQYSDADPYKNGTHYKESFLNLNNDKNSNKIYSDISENNRETFENLNNEETDYHINNFLNEQFQQNINMVNLHNENNNVTVEKHNLLDEQINIQKVSNNNIMSINNQNTESISNYQNIVPGEAHINMVKLSNNKITPINNIYNENNQNTESIHNYQNIVPNEAHNNIVKLSNNNITPVNNITSVNNITPVNNIYNENNRNIVPEETHINMVKLSNNKIIPDNNIYNENNQNIVPEETHINMVKLSNNKITPDNNIYNENNQNIVPEETHINMVKLSNNKNTQNTTNNLNKQGTSIEILYDDNYVGYQQNGQENKEINNTLQRNINKMNNGNKKLVNTKLNNSVDYYNKIYTRSSSAPTSDHAETNELKYGDLNYIGPLNKGMANKDYTFVSPDNWYPIPPSPPVCVTNKSCSTCPIIISGGQDYMNFSSLEDFDKSRRFTGNMGINTEYIHNVLNNDNGY